MIKEKIKQEKAVTLTAIIITVIVLVIIAGVSLALFGGENGILSKAKAGVSEYKMQSLIEKIELKIGSISLEKNGEVNLEDLINLKDTDNEITNAYMNGDNALLILNDEYQCEINPKLEIVSITNYQKEEKNRLLKSKKSLYFDDFSRE